MDAEQPSSAGPPEPVAVALPPASAPTARFSADGKAIPVEKAFNPTPAIDKMQEGRRAARAFHLGQAEARKATLVGMALLGYQTREIAAQTNLSPTTVSHYLAELRRSGELTAGLEHSMQRFRDEAIPLAMDNAIQKLIDGDDKATWKTLDGAGITASKDKSGHVPVLPALTLNVINVPQGPAPTFGQTVGVPHPIDVEPGNGT